MERAKKKARRKSRRKWNDEMGNTKRNNAILKRDKKFSKRYRKS